MDKATYARFSKLEDKLETNAENIRCSMDSSLMPIEGVRIALTAIARGIQWQNEARMAELWEQMEVDE